MKIISLILVLFLTSCASPNEDKYWKDVSQYVKELNNGGN